MPLVAPKCWQVLHLSPIDFLCYNKSKDSGVCTEILHHGKEPRMFESHVFARSAAHSAVLYWDKPAAAKAGAQYTVYLDGQPAATCDRTHFTLTDLRSQADYRADVFFAGRCVGSCEFRTTPVKHRIDVTEAPFWAKGDGKTKNTAALQRAIDACGAGDAVYLPAGTYLTGALRLHSNMELYLDEGAVLQGTAEIVDYQPRIPSRFEGVEMRCYSSLLNLGTLDHTAGPNCENVVIRGKGVIASGGRELADKIIADEREHLKDYLAEHAALVAECDNERTIPGRVRPRLINMSNCRNVWVHGLTLKNGASWNQHMIYSDNIITDHCRFISEGVWNGDGWDPDSSTNCTLFACEFSTGDDAVAIKSGKNPEGNKINRPSAHIYIFDCRSTAGHGICLGSEMSGGIEDVQIWDCDLTNSWSGIEIKGTPKRGGYVRGVTVRDCTAPRLMVHAVPYNNDGEPAPSQPVFSHMSFERLTLTGRGLRDGGFENVEPIELAGFDAPGHELRDVTLDAVTVENETGTLTLPLQFCRGLTIRDLTCTARK